MLRRIMVALDGSQLAEQTVPFATAIAKAFDAEIILLRVVEGPGVPMDRALGSFDWRMERTEAIEYLQRVKQRVQEQGVPVDLDVTAGRASDEILEMARARDVDLIVVGSHGAGGMSEFRMAGTAQKVVFASDMSVLIVPARDNVPEGPPFESVLVPVDCSSRSDWALALAATLARAEGADLIVLHVVEQPTVLDRQGTAREREIVDELVAMNRRAATRYVDAVKRRCECPETTVHTRVEVAERVAPVLERHANERPRSLLVLSARGSTSFDDGPHGSLAAVMIAHTTHPLLVLRERAREPEGRRRWLRSGDSMVRGRAASTIE